MSEKSEHGPLMQCLNELIDRDVVPLRYFDDPIVGDEGSLRSMCHDAAMLYLYEKGNEAGRTLLSTRMMIASKVVEMVADHLYSLLRIKWMKINNLDTVNYDKMPYEVYLRTEHWKITRYKALAHAGHKCQLCNSDKHLHVHHRTYERIGKEQMSDLTVLCSRCHAKFHDIPRKKKRATTDDIFAYLG